jgi:hypothetical protein
VCVCVLCSFGWTLFFGISYYLSICVTKHVTNVRGRVSRSKMAYETLLL